MIDRLFALLNSVEERLHEQRQVLAALAQRRQLDREHVEPVVQVLAQLALLHRVGGIDVGRRDHAHVDRLLHRGRRAAGTVRSCSTRSSFTCVCRRHLGDLVEEQRAAIGELEAALPPLDGAGERALLVAEELALEQRLGNRRAVDRHERHGRARAQLVDRLRDQLLAGAASRR